VKLLLGLRADVCARNTDGHTLLVAAVLAADPERRVFLECSCNCAKVEALTEAFLDSNDAGTRCVCTSQVAALSMLGLCISDFVLDVLCCQVNAHSSIKTVTWIGFCSSGFLVVIGVHNLFLIYACHKEHPELLRQIRKEAPCSTYLCAV